MKGSRERGPFFYGECRMIMNYECRMMNDLWVFVVYLW